MTSILLVIGLCVAGSLEACFSDKLDVPSIPLCEKTTEGKKTVAVRECEPYKEVCEEFDWGYYQALYGAGSEKSPLLPPIQSKSSEEIARDVAALITRDKKYFKASLSDKEIHENLVEAIQSLEELGIPIPESYRVAAFYFYTIIHARDQH